MDNMPSPTSNKKQIIPASEARSEKRKLDKLQADEHSNCPNSIEN
jgi:hypothetical protein